KQMVKLFSRLFNSDPHEMQLDLEQEGDISETLRKFFESSSQFKPQTNSTLYLQEVEEFLQKLEQRHTFNKTRSTYECKSQSCFGCI
ncbi:hypothetical protein DOY81_015669, partial [Sarcophaga bullata]